MMATGDGYRRVLYISVPVSSDLEMDRLRVIERSQRNNGLDGVTGVLWSSADLYVQVIEGAPDTVEATFSRIRRDPRHRDVEVLSDTTNPNRVFGSWAMLGLWDEGLTTIRLRLHDLVLESQARQASWVASQLGR